MSAGLYTQINVAGYTHGLVIRFAKQSDFIISSKCRWIYDWLG